MVQNNEYKILSEQIKGLTTLINAQFLEVHERLDKINGKVAKHDDQIQEALIERAKNREEQKNIVPNHILSCPVGEKVPELESAMSEFKTCAVKIHSMEKELEDLKFFLRHPKLLVGILVTLTIITLVTFLDNNPFSIFVRDTVKTEQVK